MYKISLPFVHAWAINSDNKCMAASWANDCGLPHLDWTTDSLHVVVKKSGHVEIGIV